jgi:hypothetical protein
MSGDDYLPVGASAVAKLPTHHAFAMLVKVEGPTDGALIKGEDAENRTVTVAFLKNRGDNPDEHLHARYGQPRAA